jgi:hypothetical protein
MIAHSLVALSLIATGLTFDTPQPGMIDRAKNQAKQQVQQAVADNTKAAQDAVAQADAAMQAWIAAGQPGAAHEILQEFTGTWDGASEMFFAPDAPPEQSTGVMVNSCELGGRWIKQAWTGTAMGQPFEGIGYFGYDNVKKKYVGNWIDSMSTGMMLMEGDYDPKTKTFTMHGSMTDPTGQTMKVRHHVAIQSVDRHVFEMYSTGPDGKEKLDGRITYTRRR